MWRSLLPFNACGIVTLLVFGLFPAAVAAQEIEIHITEPEDGARLLCPFSIDIHWSPLPWEGFVVDPGVFADSVAKLGLELGPGLVALHVNTGSEEPVSGPMGPVGPFFENLDEQFTISRVLHRASGRVTPKTIEFGPWKLTVDASFYGPTIDIVTGEWEGPWMKYDRDDEIHFTLLPFFINASPTNIHIEPGASENVSVSIVRGCTVSSAPASMQVFIQPSDVSIEPSLTASPDNFEISPSETSRSFTLSASGDTDGIGGYSIAIKATLVDVDGESQARVLTLPVTVAFDPPVITSIIPTLVNKNDVAKISGQNFGGDDAGEHCSVADITLDGVAVSPLPGCTSTALEFEVPSNMRVGRIPVTVTVNNLTSNPVSLNVARDPGAFQDISGEFRAGPVHKVCSPGGIYVVDVAVDSQASSEDSLRATFRTSGGGLAGAFSFSNRLDYTDPVTNVEEDVRGLGWAYFARCLIGIVLDASAGPAISNTYTLKFLDLQTRQALAPYLMSGYVPDLYNDAGSLLEPRVQISPDGSLVLIASSSLREPGSSIPTGQSPRNYTVAFIDLVEGGAVIRRLFTDAWPLPVTGNVLPDNRISYKVGAASEITFSIP